ncbi:hypothetical protein SNOG_14378 [Parastagonospora nodorum SN15]|uniref:Uncharacterized protein n=1 Tax=Phaeosphaeria nodorum (strain SN15 / ATCC MYA-4574 / FGSC 10173) TaxID=321614 RepID=Q0U1J6_PHANO|nr:hypothetical protein SNOG_14378 [Parastagonospora nodorum SN15]EAT78249.1 hypothetical protein SNOG_14378 [Parastagonospora nodorum SN15]
MVAKVFTSEKASNQSRTSAWFGLVFLMPYSTPLALRPSRVSSRRGGHVPSSLRIAPGSSLRKSLLLQVQPHSPPTEIARACMTSLVSKTSRRDVQ